jgi:PIN domain nuclease of toxin-antitoxin system
MTLRAVLDASAILVLLLNEPGADQLTDDVLIRSVACTVNLAEVQSKLVSRGYDPQEAWEDALSLVVDVIPFSQQMARIAGDLVKETKPSGLSLGDRACLALAISLKGEVYTAERSWNALQLGIPIHEIR